MEVRRIFDLLEHYKQNFAHKDDVLAGKENGTWKKYNIEQYIEASNQFSCGLLALEIKKGDKIVTISNNRPEWNFIDMGMAQIGVVHVPVYPTISKDDYAYIIEHSEAKLVIVSDKSLFEKIKPIAEHLKVTIYTINKVNGARNWQEIIDAAKNKEKELQIVVEQLKNEIAPDDLFTMIYTSGTTGFPKGVMLSHRNILSNVIATSKIHSNGPESKGLSFLPLSHIYERMLNYHFQFKGISIYYAENMGTIGENLKEVHPQIFCSVPRILELFLDKVHGTAHDLSFLKRHIFFWALRLGSRYELNKKHHLLYQLKLFIAEKLVYKKIREALGGNIDLIVSGGASLQTRIARIFWAARIRIIEGYGLSETSPVIAANNIIISNGVRIGTVGPVLEGVEVKIADDGEILCRGENIMMGYFKSPELTKEAIDADGWFHTGDIGEFEKGKFLKITDRKKEIFKLNNGKYIAPQVIENKLKESEFIAQAIVIGENEKFASALVQPNFPYLHDWCSKHKIHFQDNADLITIDKVSSLFQKVINEINSQLGQTENIKRFKLISDEWSNTTGELSPTLKLRRKYICDKYKEIIDQIYLSQKN